MFFKLQPLLYSIIFAAMLEMVAWRQDLFFKVMIFLVVFSIIVVWPLAKRMRFLAIPFFLSVGSLNLLFLVDQPAEKHVFIFISSIVYYLALLGAYRLKFYDRDQTAQGMVNLATIATIFFWYTSNYGWYLNFEIETWFLVLTFVASTFLISLPSFRICAAAKIKEREDLEKNLETKTIQAKPSIDALDCFKINKKTILFLNFTLSLAMAEMIWALSLWPFNYLTTGVVALIIYFVFWDVVRNFLLGTLDRKAVLANVALATLSIVGILATIKWELMV